jgi:hypothetical protein
LLACDSFLRDSQPCSARAVVSSMSFESQVKPSPVVCHSMPSFFAALISPPPPRLRFDELDDANTKAAPPCA